ncbi:DUF4260 family protein [Sorangium sp. So ce233]|uniref:DUF4260 family protein n=1 Tax=Sorangium sp. So ce233 TaxID=3133290 RepID=UPI003F638066
MSKEERGEHRGKHLGANDLAARDAHGAAVGTGGARHGALEGARARGDGLGVGQRGKRELGRHQAVRRAGEKHDAELRPLLAAASVALGSPALLLGAAICVGHIGLDRMLGYGLKYGTAFGDTHLGRVGSKRSLEQRWFERSPT